MNRLAAETSPYLRQHRDNPVEWYPWGDDAFAAARERDVPVLLSVGYSACHWCHVMAHESFEDDHVAAAMNRSFVNVKVDREERPDVDAVYMDAVQAMTGRGGWPMTVFLTPAGEPFYGGTYYPRPTFLGLLAAVDEAWRERRDDLTGNIAALRDALAGTAHLTPAASTPGDELVAAAVDRLAESWDPEWGGFGGAPKFPSTMSLDAVLLEALHRGVDDESTAGLLAVVATSLDAMAAGGIYDHVGGGFARYSVDERWLVPHFEKMLYDQALLLRVYTHAAAVLRAPRWRQVVDETIEYLLRDLRLPGGAFASAEDADSPGPDGHHHEGRFTTWTPDEVAEVLDAAAPAFCEFYGITVEGNFEGRSIPHRLGTWPAGWQRPAEIEASRRRLLEARQRRPRPGLDDKVLTEWNALAVAALAEAGALLGEPAWVEAAVETATFLLAELRDERGRWRRAWHPAGTPAARHDALAADHACLVDAFTRLAEATGQARWVDEAVAVADVLLEQFWDDEQGALFTTPADGERLIVRQKDLQDNATPSANSTAAVAFQRLSALTGLERYHERAERTLRLLAPLVPRAPGAFGNALLAFALESRGTTEVAVGGERADLVAVVRERWRPDVVLAWGERYPSPLWDGRRDGLAYVCRDYACRAPTDDPDELRRQLSRR